MLWALYRMFGVKKIMKKSTHKVIRLPDTVHCSGNAKQVWTCRVCRAVTIQIFLEL